MNDSVSEMAGGFDALKKDKRRKAGDGASLPLDRLPPYDEGAEQGVVGCVLLSPSACLDGLDELGMQGEWFYCLPLRKIFETARAMHFRQPPVPVDVVTISSELRQMGVLEEVGGYAFLNQLQDGVPSAANVTAYAEVVREFWQLRAVLATAGQIEAGVRELTEAKRAGLTVERVIDEAQAAINRLSELHTRRSERKIKAILNESVIPKLERHYTRGRAQITGLVTTGLEYLDKIFCGLGGENGNYHVVGARPNVGKTSLITGMALHAALDFEFVEEITAEQARAFEAQGLKPFGDAEGRFFLKKKGVPVGISSLEMSSDSLAFKMLFQRARADLQLWRTGYASKEDFPPLVRAAGQLATPDNILIDDTPRENIASIKAKWRRWHRQHGVRFFMLDYIQLIKSTAHQHRPDRVQEMEEISAEFQALGKELNCPMLILAQLNRDYEKEPNRLPRLSDLKNCGAIEQDADSVTLLYKPSPNKPFSKDLTEAEEFFRETMEKKFGEGWRKWSGRPERINALVEKNKHGPKGDAQLLFLKASTLFVDYDAWLKREGYRAASKGEESRYKPEGQGQLGETNNESES